MAINRVDVTGTFIRQDVAQLKADENNRAMADMANLSVQFEREAEENHIALKGPESLDSQNQKYDAKEEGKNKYLLDGKKNSRKKKKGEADGVVIGPSGRRVIGGFGSSFDLKI